MNAAARMIHQSTVFNGQFSEIRLSKSLCLQISLLVMLLGTALAVVYTTNQHRLSYNRLQLATRHAHQLELQWGQLLLEQASLVTPGRVETLAKEKLKMMVPDDRDVHILRAK